MRQADVIVVGAGVLGTFHAYFAALRGYRTILIERNAFPNDASTRNFGMIARSIVGIDAPWADYVRATIEIYRALQNEHDIAVRQTGSLYLASTEYERRVLAEFAQGYGAEYRCAYLDSEDACSRYPIVRASYCAGALLFPDDLTLEPRQMLRRLISHLVDRGLLEYVPHTTVVEARRDGEGCRLVNARGNVFAAGHGIVCTGAEYRTLFPRQFEQSGLRMCKLQIMQTVPLPPHTLPHAILSGLSIRRYPAFAACPSYRTLLDEPIDARLQEFGIHLLFKQASDGGVVIGDSHEYTELSTASTLEETTSAAINEAILEYGRRILDLPSWSIARMWNGYYVQHPNLPIYTETIDERIHIVTGIGGKGMTTGPGFAQHSINRLLPSADVAD